ncbi:MAG: hypothetical protein Kow0099_08170 [Candidatus Abyssubacteria bacterium]
MNVEKISLFFLSGTPLGYSAPSARTVSEAKKIQAKIKEMTDFATLAARLYTSDI